MLPTIALTLFLLLTIIPFDQAQTVRLEWNYLNFTWLSSEAYYDAIETGSYIPKNTVITGIKVWKDDVYLALPRWKNGVPVTLATVTSRIHDNGTKSPLLKPYPNWDMQKLDNCSAFQYVQSMEIDPGGRMWVLENGRTEFRTLEPKTRCPPRLVILDLNDDGKVLLDHTFSMADVVHREDVFLNDLVLDHEDGGWAYITDHSSEFPGIIVFSLKDKTSWKVTHESMMPKVEASKFVVDGSTIETMGPIDGIALSEASTEGQRILYYTPLSSYELFSVPVRALKCRDIDDKVTFLGRKSSQTDGMIISASGILYFGLLTENKINQWDTKGIQSFSIGQKILTVDKVTNQWPDTFAMDDGQLWWTSNRLTKYMNDEIDLTAPNYRVFSLKTDSKSYQYYKNGNYPSLPAINL